METTLGSIKQPQQGLLETINYNLTIQISLLQKILRELEKGSVNINKDRIRTGETGMSTRTINALLNQHINYLDQLENVNINEIKWWRGVGGKAISEIKEVAGKYNINLI